MTLDPDRLYWSVLTLNYINALAQIWVYGNSFESFLVAVVVPERKALEEWATNNNISEDFKSLCGNPEARKFVLDEINSTGKNLKVSSVTMFPLYYVESTVLFSYMFYPTRKKYLQLRGFEMLRAVHLEPIPFDMERDLITPTFKLTRPQLLKYYKVSPSSLIRLYVSRNWLLRECYLNCAIPMIFHRISCHG